MTNVLRNPRPSVFSPLFRFFAIFLGRKVGLVLLWSFRTPHTRVLRCSQTLSEAHTERRPPKPTPNTPLGGRSDSSPLYGRSPGCGFGWNSEAAQSSQYSRVPVGVGGRCVSGRAGDACGRCGVRLYDDDQPAGRKLLQRRRAAPIHPPLSPGT